MTLINKTIKIIKQKKHVKKKNKIIWSPTKQKYNYGCFRTIKLYNQLNACDNKDIIEISGKTRLSLVFMITVDIVCKL